MDWASLDWNILERLREGFISGRAAEGPYWQSSDDLAHYDFTYAERIGWKWDHVLSELRQRGWSPPRGTLLDWGCGSGVAHRRMAEAWPSSVTGVQVFDHSTLAESFSIDRMADTHPTIETSSWERSETITTLTISHVLNELDEENAEDLMATIEAADAVIWVEPGTSDVAAQLVAWRERLRKQFTVVYPCPHQGTCGLTAPENARHWCHHFAAPPTGVFADSNWVKFGQRAGIDLRSLPYSALVLEKTSRDAESASGVPPDSLGRIIGRPKVSKPYTRFLGCDAEQVQRLEMPKKLNAQLAKKLDRPNSPRLFKWQHEAGKVTSISPEIRES